MLLQAQQHTDNDHEAGHRKVQRCLNELGNDLGKEKQRGGCSFGQSQVVKNSLGKPTCKNDTGKVYQIDLPSRRFEAFGPEADHTSHGIAIHQSR